MLECIHSLVTVHKYPLISMKRHLMEGQSDKHVQAFTHSLRKWKGENVIQICLLNTKYHIPYVLMCAFPAPCPSFTRLRCVLSQGKAVGQVLEAHKALQLFLLLGCKVWVTAVSLGGNHQLYSKPSWVFGEVKGRLFASEPYKKILFGLFLIIAPKILRNKQTSLFQWVRVTVEKKKVVPLPHPLLSVSFCKLICIS